MVTEEDEEQLSGVDVYSRVSCDNSAYELSSNVGAYCFFGESIPDLRCFSM
jgi:hypothetical protein